MQGLFQRRVIVPLLNLLRVGATPRQLAWSLAIGCVIGVNPLLGSTTALCLLLAWVFRLNLIASQIANHLMYPLELALLFFFIRAGDTVFHTAHLPLDRDALLAAVRHHPLATTRMLWMWEWHALVVWAAFAAVAAPLISLLLHPMLKRLLHTLHEHPTTTNPGIVGLAHTNQPTITAPQVPPAANSCNPEQPPRCEPKPYKSGRAAQ